MSVDQSMKNREPTAAFAVRRLRNASCFVLALMFCVESICADEESRLPLVTDDRVVVRSEGGYRPKTISCVIEDIAGQKIVVRRSGSTVNVIRLQDVVSVQFRKSEEFNDGLKKLQERDWKTALTSLQTAATTENRNWARREINAHLAQAYRALGEFEGCLATVEKIVQDDPDTRHVVELPLVWDERLPATNRIQLAAADLKSPSEVRRLTAASALLHDSSQETAAVAVLKDLEKSSTGVLLELVRAQLWRLRLLHPDQLREAEVSSWSQSVRQLDRRTRSGPEFIIGRALLATHDYDNAATSLLWMPLLEPLDPPTTNASLQDAITALELSGRQSEADKLRSEYPRANDADK
jgi:tetratricopeptide (TPR) repeat protein